MMISLDMSDSGLADRAVLAEALRVLDRRMEVARADGDDVDLQHMSTATWALRAVARVTDAAWEAPSVPEQARVDAFWDDYDARIAAAR